MLLLVMLPEACLALAPGGASTCCSSPVHMPPATPPHPAYHPGPPHHLVPHTHPPASTSQGASTEDIQRRLHTLELLAAASGGEGQRPINQLFQMPTIVTGLAGGSHGGAAEQPQAPSPEAAAVASN